jgi:MoaA/NifB/PqqE/SkfB family radical SAM enzyme
MESTSPANISAAGLLLSYWCNARCAHCYELSGPRRQGWMSVADARRHFEALARLGLDASGVHIGGGEPFGNYERLLDVIRAAREAGLAGVGYVETNGFWATSDDLACRRMSELREAGMRQISISADVFHQAYVDPACPVRLWRAATAVLGQSGVRARRWQFLKSPLDLRGFSEPERREAYREALLKHPERLTGRAARELAGLRPRRPATDFSTESCDEGLRGGGHVHIDPRGHVFPGTCVGLLLGRVDAASSLDRILCPPRGRLWQILTAAGPLGLRDTVAAPLGYRDEPEGYADKCHLCTSVRTFLFRSGNFSDELGPREVYEED